MLTMRDVLYLQSRDGDSTTTDNPATPVAFVIDGEVAIALGFSPKIGEDIFLSNPIYTSRIEEIDGKMTEIITANVNGNLTDMILSEHLTAVLLSNPQAIKILRNRDIAVMNGWLYDENGFYINQTINGVVRRINGMGSIVE